MSSPTPWLPVPPLAPTAPDSAGAADTQPSPDSASAEAPALLPSPRRATVRR